jgi:cyclophilin family peptidyl-prolyl cis-trans isomerase
MLFTNTSFTSLKRHIKISANILGLSAALITAQSAMATIVQFQTVMGDFQVNLYDKATPKTVENFLTYVKAGAYTNSVIHRVLPGFVVQGGGYKYDTKFPLINIAQNAAVINEPVYSNVRGTIAMAKLDTPNSATNQFYFNIVDNSKSLDINNKGNGGYTVFGEVTGNGMAIIDTIATLNIFNIDNVALKNFPLKNYTTADATNNVAITDKNLVLILGVVILDANIDSAANLTPTKNTLINTTSNNGGSSGSGGGGGSGGGSIDFISLLLLASLSVLGFRRK